MSVTWKENTPRKDAFSRDFRKQYKVHPKSGDWQLYALTTAFPAEECSPLPFVLYLVISSAHLRYYYLSILPFGLGTRGELVRLDCAPFYANSILYKILISGCVSTWETPFYKQPLSPVWVQMQKQNASVSWSAGEYHNMPNTTHEAECDL